MTSEMMKQLDYDEGGKIQLASGVALCSPESRMPS